MHSIWGYPVVAAPALVTAECAESVVGVVIAADSQPAAMPPIVACYAQIAAPTVLPEAVERHFEVV